MKSVLKLQGFNPAIHIDSGRELAGNFISFHSKNLKFRGFCNRRFAFLALKSDNVSSEPSVSTFTSSIGSSPPPPQLSPWSITQRHILVLNFIACAAAVSATLLFLSAIPTLLAFKRAAESLEKLLDVTREELPNTMAAVRLSGMEISDLTMELSDLGQEITQGVKSSTRAVRSAEEKLRHLTNMIPSASMQESIPNRMEVEQKGPAVARTARSIREGIVKSRAYMQMFFTLTRFSKMAHKFLTSRDKS